MSKYTNSKTYCFKYNFEFNHDFVYREIKKEMDNRLRDVVKLIVFNKNKKTYCFLELNDRLQTKDRYFLTIFVEKNPQFPVFYNCAKKKKLLEIFNKYNFTYYN